MTLLGGQGGYFQKSSKDSKTSDMTSEGSGEMFEGDSADTCAAKFLLMLMGGRAEGLACTDPVARTPIGVSGNLNIFCFVFCLFVTACLSLLF